MEPYVQANTDGRLHAADEPSIAPLNRGFLYGDAVYEVWRTYDRVIFAFEEHWVRLARSAAALSMTLPFDREGLLAEIARTVSAFDKKVGAVGDVYIRLQVTRGGGPIGLDPALADRPSWVILVQKLKALSAEQLEKGLRLSRAQNLRRNPIDALNPAWKTGNYLNNLLCLHEARGRGADEVIIENREGFVCEAAVCNVFFVSEREVLTPAIICGLLEGVTRKIILNRFKGFSLPITEERIRGDQIGGFRECFLTSTTRDIVPVRSIDHVVYHVSAESATRRLKTMFAQYVAEYNRGHPDLRLA